MTDEGAKMIADSIKELSGAIRYVGSSIAEDSSLGEWVSTALSGMVEDIVQKGLVHTVYLKGNVNEPVSVQMIIADNEETSQ